MIGSICALLYTHVGLPRFPYEEKSLLGAAHVPTSGTKTQPGSGPVRFKKAGKNAGGAKVRDLDKLSPQPSKCIIPLRFPFWDGSF